jgi:hypothetical protein
MHYQSTNNFFAYRDIVFDIAEDRSSIRAQRRERAEQLH